MPVSFKLIEPAEASQLVDQGRLILIDVRNADEWRSQGVPHGAHTIALTDPSFTAKVLQLSGENSGALVAITCLSGKRSEQAIEVLEKAGLKNLYSVKRGLQGWADAGLAIKHA